MIPTQSASHNRTFREVYTLPPLFYTMWTTYTSVILEKLIPLHSIACNIVVTITSLWSSLSFDIVSSQSTPIKRHKQKEQHKKNIKVNSFKARYLDFGRKSEADLICRSKLVSSSTKTTLYKFSRKVTPINANGKNTVACQTENLGFADIYLQFDFVCLLPPFKSFWPKFMLRASIYN